MLMFIWEEFEAEVAGHLQSRNSAAIVELLPVDPLDRFAHGFNRHMEEVEADEIEIAYFMPLFVIARCIEAGKVPDVATLFKLLFGIQRRVGMKLGANAKRHAKPQIKALRRKGDQGRPPESQLLFAPDGSELELQPGREDDPSYKLLRGELFKELLNAVRSMGKLQQRAFREVQIFAEKNRTRYGAFKAVAARAELDEAGNVVAIRAENPNGAASATPTDRTVRQVREFYQEAANYLNGRKIWEGRKGL